VAAQHDAAVARVQDLDVLLGVVAVGSTCRSIILTGSRGKRQSMRSTKSLKLATVQRFLSFFASLLPS
jgi:hypothetical protein